jgi:hypothetical protein
MPSIVVWFLSMLNAPGAFQRFTWRTAVKPAAAHRGVTLEKVTTATARTQAEYKNFAENRDRETGALPFGKWLVYPTVIAHKDRYYGRLYVLDGSIRTVYYVDGAEVDRDTFLSYLTPSQRKPSRPTAGCITVALDNFVR